MSTDQEWQPEYERWRHGGWYVTNTRYPSGAVGCVSNNFADKRWRIVCSGLPHAVECMSFSSRDAAARAEHAAVLTLAWARAAQNAYGGA